MEPHRRAHAGRDTRDDHRPDAGWLRAVECRRILQGSLLGCLYCSANVVGCCGYIYAVFRGESSSQHSSHRRRLRRDLRNTKLPKAASAHFLVGVAQIPRVRSLPSHPLPTMFCHGPLQPPLPSQPSPPPPPFPTAPPPPPQHSN